jgi:cyclopropane-fatty-acyl-phospholipid synthase
MTTYTDVEQKAEADLGPSRLSSWARRSLFTLFGSLKHGRITIEDEFGRTTFGQGQPQVTLSILDQRTYTRLLLSGSVGAAESYIDGMWKCDDLTTLMRIIIRNMALLDKIESTFGPFLQPIRKIQQWLRRNNHEGAKKNILAHYDLGNEMYKSFLDETMMYSSAIFPDENSSLEQGSIYKLEVICQKLGLSPGDRIVEIGSGWGGFAIYAASHYGCHVTTTTISDAQFEEAKLRIREAGLEEKITLLKKDYRDLTGSYDKLVSIEMIEAVGYSYLPDFF